MALGASRLDGLGTTIFTDMSALAVRTGSINLGQGFPDEDGPASVLEAASTALRSGANQYAPGRGVPALQEAIAAHQRRHYGIELDPRTEVIVTTGATEGIAAALLGLIDPGDEVVVLEPYYDSYRAMLQMAGAIRRPVTLRAPDFRLDTEELAAAVTPGTRAILLNSPHNPTGTVLTETELSAVARVAVEHDLIVITDEVYERLTYDDHVHYPLATFPGMAERTLSLSSAGKSFSVTGWKIGWASGPADLVEATLRAKQWLTFTSGAPLQPAVAHALNHADDYPAELRVRLQTRRDLLCAGLRELGLELRVPEGTYFVTTDVSRWGWEDGMAFCQALPERAGVVAIPSQAFYDNRDYGRTLVRWAFCKDEDQIEAALDKLGRADLFA